MINSCGIRFGPNGKIIVTGHGGYLQSIGSHYFGCNGGWYGIYVDGNGILNMYADRVEDAQYAVTIASNYAQITLQNCFFNRNITDIEVYPGIAANALITNNVFDCTSNTYLGGRSSTGIHTNNGSTLNFGMPSGLPNIVRNHLVGAFAYSSILNIRNGEFACNTQRGIQSIAGRLDIRTNSSLSTFNYFKHNRQDIYTRGTVLSVQATQFTECETDNIVSSNNTHAEPIDLQLNYFNVNNDNVIPIATSTHLKSAITVDRSSGASGSGYLNKIEGNAFYFDPFSIGETRSAVRAFGLPGTYDFMKINANTVNILAGGSMASYSSNPTFLFETVVNTADGFLITSNNIFTQNIDDLDYSGRFGFYIHDWVSPSSEHFLQDNRVIGTSTAFDYGMCAFHFEDSGPWNICNNEADFTLRGFHINGICSPSVFGGNIMNHHHRSSSTHGNHDMTAGLLLEEGAVLGPQFCRRNHFTFSNYAPDAGAWHKAMLPADVITSRFDYNPTIADQKPNPEVASTTWFFGNFSCTDTLPQFHCGVRVLSTKTI